MILIYFLVSIGKLKPTAAFMSGKLKLKGDMGKAMALDKLMAKMNSARGYHTLTNNYVISNKGTDDEGMVGDAPKSKL